MNPSGNRSDATWDRAAAVRLTAFAVAVVGAASIAVSAGPDVETLRGWTTATGWVAPAAFVALYSVLTVALVPGSVLTLASGLLFGAVLGTALTVVGATAGATIAFVVARSAGRPAVERLVSGRTERVDTWLQGQGLAAVITLRLVPLVPFSAANYAAGLTRIRLKDFVVGTAVGILPGTVVYNLLGAHAADPTDPRFLGAMAALAALTIAGTARLRRSAATSTPRSAVASSSGDRHEPASSPP